MCYGDCISVPVRQRSSAVNPGYTGEQKHRLDCACYGGNLKPSKIGLTFKYARPYIVRNLIVQPFIYVLIPGILLAYYQIDKLQKPLKLHWRNAYDFLNGHCLAVILVAIGINCLGIGIREVFERVRVAQIEKDRTPAAIITAIGNVVGKKDRRFGNLVRQLVRNSNPLSGDEVFNTITQPHDQIGSLVEAVWHIFQDISRGEDSSIVFEASLISVTPQGTLNQFEHYFPNDQHPGISIELLRDGRSCASRALRQGLVIVSDFQAELRKKSNKFCTQCYVTTPEKRNNDGSMFAYRIDHYWTGKPIYVLSVCCNKKRYISEYDGSLYTYIMKEIQTRVNLEHSLAILRDHVGGKK